MAKSILVNVSLAVNIEVEDNFVGNPSAAHLTFLVTAYDGLDQKVTVIDSSVVDSFIVEDERNNIENV